MPDKSIGIIANCLYCDSYFLQGIDTINTESISNKKQLEEIYLSLQLKYTIHRRYQLLHCPTCTELIYNMKFNDFLTNHPDQECKLSMCKFIDFLPKDTEINYRKKKMKVKTKDPQLQGGKTVTEVIADSEPDSLLKDSKLEKDVSNEDQRNLSHNVDVKEFEIEEIDDGIPLYTNLETNKPLLCFGLGPKTIELDSSHSGRIYKPFLRQFGIVFDDIIQLKRDNNNNNNRKKSFNAKLNQGQESVEDWQNSMNFQQYEHINETTNKALMNYSEDKKGLISMIEMKKPLYKNWSSVAEEIESMVILQLKNLAMAERRLK